MRAIVYDTGALLAAERLDRPFLALHRDRVSAHTRPIVPVVVLAQAWRGGPQHAVSQLLKGCDVVPDDKQIGRAAGVLCASAGTSDVVDAIVVATAVRHQASVVSSDPGDLSRLAEAIGVKLRLFAV
jgi:predicted nucleic acid-binding protein